MNISAERLVWIDCEMTGLDAVNDALIEVAVIVTDDQLHPLGEGVDVVIAPPEGAIDRMGDFVRTMHTNSGLLKQLEAGTSMSEATRIVMDYITEHVPEAGKALLAGNSVGTDKQFLARDMPELIEYLHYRLIDVSTIKELAKRWYPSAYHQAPAKTGNHRALGDIEDSINELRYYREAVFVSEPGPRSAEARSIARKYEDAAAQ